jgi:hypothetical protein
MTKDGGQAPYFRRALPLLVFLSLVCLVLPAAVVTLYNSSGGKVDPPTAVVPSHAAVVTTPSPSQVPPTPSPSRTPSPTPVPTVAPTAEATPPPTATPTPKPLAHITRGQTRFFGQWADVPFQSTFRGDIVQEVANNRDSWLRMECPNELPCTRAPEWIPPKTSGYVVIEVTGNFSNPMLNPSEVELVQDPTRWEHEWSRKHPSAKTATISRPTLGDHAIDAEFSGPDPWSLGASSFTITAVVLAGGDIAGVFLGSSPIEGSSIQLTCLPDSGYIDYRYSRSKCDDQGDEVVFGIEKYVRYLGDYPDVRLKTFRFPLT